MPASSPNRVPTLDGLRAVSILMVIVAHQFIQYRELHPLGVMGVRIFFLISGYIITLLLVEERRRTGRVSLAGFYARRTRRIFPACYAYVTLVLVLTMLGKVHDIDAWDFAHAYTYTTNFADRESRHWLFGHLWSLAVEEQFYLLWPFTFILFSERICRPLLVGIIGIVPLLRLAEAMSLIPPFGLPFYGQADTLAAGCLLALRRPSRAQNVVARMPHWSVALVVAGGLAAAYAWSLVRSPYAAGFAPSIANLAVVCLISKEVVPSRSWAFRLLNCPLAVNLGFLSYSLYLWQQPLVFPAVAPRQYAIFPVNYIAMFILALFSYYCIEKRFRK